LRWKGGAPSQQSRHDVDTQELQAKATFHALRRLGVEVSVTSSCFPFCWFTGICRAACWTTRSATSDRRNADPAAHGPGLHAPRV